MIPWILTAALAQQLAFPGAEGFGAFQTGGRGGAVVKVTTLNPSGPGSLQEAMDTAGPRIVVFDVSGVIEGDIHIPHGDLTLAGESAPGAGITIRGHLYTTYGQSYGNFIIRHIRVRPPGADADWPPSSHDAIQFSGNTGMILDHVDASHGIDENIDLWNAATDVTIQWSAVTWPVIDGGHPDGPEHNYGIINGPGGGRISIHHTLFAHDKTRTPALAEGPADVRNNVVYNGREGFVHHNPAAGDFNLIGNTYIDGPSASLAPFWIDPENYNPPTQYYSEGNEVEDPGNFTGTFDDPFAAPADFQNSYTFSCCGIGPSHFVGTAFDWSSDPGYQPIATQPASDAYTDVLDCAGAWPRDIALLDAIDDVVNRTGAWADYDPGDWMQGLTPTSPDPDTDGDGMPDAWETANGLDPNDGTDHDTAMGGYDAIEVWLHERAAALDPCNAGTPTTPGTTTGTATGSATGTATGTGTGTGSATGSATGGSGTGTGTGTPDTGHHAIDDDKGCGCSTSGSSGPWLGILLLLARRRTRT